MPIGKRNQFGFTYVGLLIAVAVFGLGSVGGTRLIASSERAQREVELLFIGHQFRQAIRSYFLAGPKVGQYPATLDDLLLDKRHPSVRRHLRRRFFDPITGNSDWGFVQAPEGGIMGVYSLSEREPKKRANFDLEDAAFGAVIGGAIKPNLVTPKLSGAQELISSIATTQPIPMNSAPYSYRDWKFIYRPTETEKYQRGSQ